MKLARTTLLAIIVASAMPVAGAQAHDSSYCGHSRDGYWTKTVFRTHYWSSTERRHVHIYDHYDWTGRWLHWQRKYC